MISEGSCDTEYCNGYWKFSFASQEYILNLHVFIKLCALQEINCQVRKKKNKFSQPSSWSCPHTEKKYNKIKNVFQRCLLFSICKSEKVTQVQSVLKTGQRADVSASAFFSAHEAKSNNTLL